MSKEWIDQTIYEMRTNSNTSIQQLGNDLYNNESKIKKTVTAVDRTTGEIVILKLENY